MRVSSARAFARAGRPVRPAESAEEMDRQSVLHEVVAAAAVLVALLSRTLHLSPLKKA